MQNGVAGPPSIISAGQGLLMKMSITLKLHDIFDQILQTYSFEHCLDTGVQNVF